MTKDSSWQPFDTAPKDGREIIACRYLFGGNPIGAITACVIWWGDMNAADTEFADYEPNYQWLMSDGKNEPIHYRGWQYLTHWQPLPAEPGDHK